MTPAEADEVVRWRRLDREAQGLVGRRRHAQVVVDVAEAFRAAARGRGTDPVDDLLDAYWRVSRPGSQELVSAAIAYLRAEPAVTPASRAPVVRAGA